MKKKNIHIQPTIIRKGKLIGTSKQVFNDIPQAPRRGVEGAEPFSMQEFGKIYFFISVLKK
jgi:hypothetical protein